MFCLAGSLLQFIPPYKYNGTSVKVSVGSSVNFTWSFSCDDPIVLKWGLKKKDTSDFESNGVLVTINQFGAVSLSGPSSYSTRLSGSRSGGPKSGQAIFTLTSITRSDDRYYGCQISPLTGFDSSIFDSVLLVVEGGQACYLVHTYQYKCKSTDVINVTGDGW